MAEIFCKLEGMSTEQLLHFSKHDLRDIRPYLGKSCTSIEFTVKSHTLSRCQYQSCVREMGLLLLPLTAWQNFHRQQNAVNFLTAVQVHLSPADFKGRIY